MPVARRAAVRVCCRRGRLTRMRALFVLCLAVVGVGLGYFIVVGLLHR